MTQDTVEQNPVEEMRSLLRQMNQLENRVLSLQDTIASFRSDVEQHIGGARDGSTHDFTVHLPRAASPQQASRESLDV